MRLFSNEVTAAVSEGLGWERGGNENVCMRERREERREKKNGNRNRNMKK